jgi:hypothetical protein
LQNADTTVNDNQAIWKFGFVFFESSSDYGEDHVQEVEKRSQLEQGQVHVHLDGVELFSGFQKYQLASFYQTDNQAYNAEQVDYGCDYLRHELGCGLKINFFIF